MSMEGWALDRRVLADPPWKKRRNAQRVCKRANELIGGEATIAGRCKGESEEEELEFTRKSSDGGGGGVEEIDVMMMIVMMIEQQKRTARQTLCWMKLHLSHNSIMLGIVFVVPNCLLSLGAPFEKFDPPYLQP